MKSEILWEHLIGDLVKCGMTVKAIARHSGSSVPIISKLRCGTVKEPKYSLGHELVLLHEAAKKVNWVKSL